MMHANSVGLAGEQFALLGRGAAVHRVDMPSVGIRLAVPGIGVSLHPAMKNQRGFTLVELVVTISVVAILAVVAFPSMRTFILNNRATVQANAFIASVNLARSEALKRQRPALVVAIAGGSAGNEFVKGWKVFADSNRNGTEDAGEAISQSDGLAAGGSLNDQKGTGKIEFKQDGTVGEVRSFQSRISGCYGQLGRDITISRVGRVRVTRVTCS